jgi:tripartite-type tricarboxylate transporter receptor subunit TctC
MLHQPGAMLRVMGALIGTAMVCAPASVQAQDAFPSRTVRLIVGFSPGGGVDTVARLFADKLTTLLQQPVVVENRGGASGSIAGRQVASADPDGYTVLVNSNSMVINQILNSKTGFDIEKDLKPVASAAPQAIILATAPDLPAKSLKELIALAKTRPLNFGSPGAGSIPHLVVEYLFTSLSDVKMQHVPFQGAALALTATMGGQIELASVTMPPAVPLVGTGKLRGIVVTSATRSSALPDVPTALEAGIPDFVATAWTGFFVPAKTPPAVVARLNDAILKVADMPDVKEKLKALGFEPTSQSGEQFGRDLSKEIKMWTDVIAKANIKLQ